MTDHPPKSGTSKATIAVGDGGRGFIIDARNEGRLVVTAAHCLPNLPDPHPWSGKDRVWRLLAPLGEKPSIIAECLFVDPVRDVAVLGSPDNQNLPDEAEAYEKFVGAATALAVGVLPPKMFSELKGWLLSLEGSWFRCLVNYHDDGPIGLSNAAQRIVAGMSGSPILAENESAIGLISVSDGAPGGEQFGGGPNPRLGSHLPAWLLRNAITKATRSRMSERGKKALDLLKRIRT